MNTEREKATSTHERKWPHAQVLFQSRKRIILLVLFTLTDAGIGVAAGGAALVLLVPRSTAASEADCVGLGVSLTKALSTLGL